MNQISKELKKIAYENIFVISFTLFYSLVVPLLQTFVIFLAYLILDSEKYNVIFDRISSFPIIGSIISELSYDNFHFFLFFLAIGTLSVQLIIKYIGDMQLVKLTYKLYLRDSQRVLHSYLWANPKSVKKISIERINSNLINDSGALSAVLRLCIIILSAVVLVVLHLTLSIFLSKKMTVIALLIFIIPFIINNKLFKNMKAVGQLKVASHEKMIGFFNDFLRGYDRIKLDILENSFYEKSTPVLNKSQEWRIKKRRIESLTQIITSGFGLFSILIIIFIGISLLSVEISSLMALVVIFTQLRGSVNTIAVSYARIIELIPSIERYFELLENIGRKYTINGESAKLSISAPQKISFKNVSFKYEDNQKTLVDIDFKANAGDRILIQGPSGHGKSTFLKVLTGLINPSNGTVKFDDKSLDPESFLIHRENILLVSPDVYLFNFSIKENLNMGYNYTDEMIKFASTNVFLDEVISELPKGFESNIGINGDNLSLGQRQRLILARLFLRNPKIVLMDEATANLNPMLEERIMKNILDYLDKNAILIMVAHKAPENINFTNSYEIVNGMLKVKD